MEPQWWGKIGSKYEWDSGGPTLGRGRTLQVSPSGSSIPHNTETWDLSHPQAVNTFCLFLSWLQSFSIRREPESLSSWKWCSWGLPFWAVRKCTVSLRLQKVGFPGGPVVKNPRANASVIVAVHSLSCVQLYATPWTAAHQASLSFTISWSLLKLISIESVMPSNHLILSCPLLLLPSIFPSIRAFSDESALRIRWPSIRASASASVLSMNIQYLFPLGLTGLLSL